MKIEIKGRLKLVGAPEKKSEKFTVQNIVISRQSLDEFGDPEGNENIYPMQVVNEDIDKLKLSSMIGKKVYATGYINGREHEGNYFTSIRLKSIAIIDTASANGFPAAVEAGNGAEVSDDLPF